MNLIEYLLRYSLNIEHLSNLILNLGSTSTLVFISESLRTLISLGDPITYNFWGVCRNGIEVLVFKAGVHILYQCFFF